MSGPDKQVNPLRERARIVTGAKGGQIVAVIDDDGSVRDAIGSLLRSAGYQAERFASAEAFLTCPRSLEFSCLVLDINLPGITGLELQHRLLAQGLRVPIVFVTATVDLQGRIRDQALQSGAVALLSKPFDALALLNAVSAALAP